MRPHRESSVENLCKHLRTFQNTDARALFTLARALSLSISLSDIYIHARNLVAVGVGLAVGDDVELARRVGFWHQCPLAQYQSCPTHPPTHTHNHTHNPPPPQHIHTHTSMRHLSLAHTSHTSAVPACVRSCACMCGSARVCVCVCVCVLASVCVRVCEGSFFF